MENTAGIIGDTFNNQAEIEAAKLDSQGRTARLNAWFLAASPFIGAYAVGAAILDLVTGNPVNSAVHLGGFVVNLATFRKLSWGIHWENLVRDELERVEPGRLVTPNPNDVIELPTPQDLFYTNVIEE